MNSLSVSPLPSARINDNTEIHRFEMDGFIDDDVVIAMTQQPRYPRTSPLPQDLVLSADEQDFAGWQLPSQPIVVPSTPAGTETRPCPPSLESGIGNPHQGGHRWWLAGLAGALSTLIVSALLINLASRHQGEYPKILSTRYLETKVLYTLEKVENPVSERELTEASNLTY